MLGSRRRSAPPRAGAPAIVTWSIIQGFGFGLVFVPLSTVAFMTLPGHLRTDGTSMLTLVRNIGSSVGISVVTFLLTQNTQRLHASLAEHITPYNVAASGFNANSTASLLQLNGLVTSQGAMIGYIDDFQLMLILTIATIPFLFMIRNVKAPAGSAPVVAE